MQVFIYLNLNILEIDNMKNALKNIKQIGLICVLSKEPMHGYELMKELEKRMGKKINPSFIYPSLKKLEKEGYIKSRVRKEGKRKIKNYIITNKGKTLCKDVKNQLKDILKEFFEK